MEPRQDEPQQEPTSGRDERKRRFQIVKLEERIAPGKGGNGGGYTHGRPCGPKTH